MSSDKGQMANLLENDFEKTVLKMLKKLKDMEKVKKMMYEQSGNINTAQRYSGAKK